jgi:hypothetical protein
MRNYDARLEPPCYAPPGQSDWVGDCLGVYGHGCGGPQPPAATRAAISGGGIERCDESGDAVTK